ncbi:hypothetical protein AM500_21490 [Bacillus sp. FJAT-18017]|uniref:hypothetical protein n=1 Tax=Bacillus sp. FJAT-18017 TaxID=1705566 RepID=UPI0006B04DDB|nr:hypothetical protein [Bacillus sp. FJAT-18017]ALC92077.1 hypothetical protein AM500_21490 [Bacillus sp. FJAT-18017]
MGYSREEQETTLVFDSSTGLWSVYSTVPKHIRKLAKLGDFKVIESENFKPIAVQGTLHEKQISMRQVRNLTDEQKEAAKRRGELLAAARAKG